MVWTDAKAVKSDTKKWSSAKIQVGRRIGFSQMASFSNGRHKELGIGENSK